MGENYNGKKDVVKKTKENSREKTVGVKKN